MTRTPPKRNTVFDKLSAKERDEILSTYILCGSIGLDEHIKMGMVKVLAKHLKRPEQEIIKMLSLKFIPHCEHVGAWYSRLMMMEAD